MQGGIPAYLKSIPTMFVSVIIIAQILKNVKNNLLT